MSSGDERQLQAILLGNKENEPIQSCCDVLAEFQYQYKLYEHNERFLNELNLGNANLLLLDADLLDAGDLSIIKNALPGPCVPIFIIIEQSDEERLDAYLEQGADDFVLKPLNPALLKAKLRLIKNARQMLQQQTVDCKQLSNYRDLVEQEQAVAANLYENILRANYLETSVVKSVVSARSLFNGDIVLVGRTPDNQLHILLGDFSGYGISAYVAAAPTAEIFYGMTAKGFDISEITLEINRKLYKLLPGDMFLSAVIVGLDPNTKTLHALNCGMPDQILLKSSSRRCKLIPSNNLPLGIIGNVDLQRNICEVNSEDYFYLMTRAVSEALKVADEKLGVDAALDDQDQNKDLAFADLLRRLRLPLNEALPSEQNDITFVELCCDVDNAPWKNDEVKQEYSLIEPLSWKAMMEFDLATLRKLNPVPVIVNALMEIQGLQEHRQTIFLIVTELFANALDHGLLKLDSAIKQTPEGFMRFYELREERLNTMEAGHIRIHFVHQPTGSGGRLVIKVKDSGDGFEFTKLDNDLGSNIGFSGRGLALLKSLCSSVSYQGAGNRVTAIFDWTH